MWVLNIYRNYGINKIPNVYVLRFEEVNQVGLTSTRSTVWRFTSDQVEQDDPKTVCINLKYQIIAISVKIKHFNCQQPPPPPPPPFTNLTNLCIKLSICYIFMRKVELGSWYAWNQHLALVYTYLPSQTKISDFRLHIEIHQNITGFNVSMD